MRLISNSTLREVSAHRPEADEALQGWRRRVEKCGCRNFAELKQAFNAVDKAGDYFVFNLGGNHYRVVAAIHFDRQKLFVRHVFTHREYDDWRA